MQLAKSRQCADGRITTAVRICEPRHTISCSQWRVRLPAINCQLDDNDDLLGLWGELNVTAHQLRKVPWQNGHMVIDFAHAVSTPIDIISN